MRYTFGQLLITFLEDFDTYLSSNFLKYDGSAICNELQEIFIDTTMELTTEELDALSTLIYAYVNPNTILELYSTISTNIQSNFTKTPGVIDEFTTIHLNKQKDTGLVINTITTIFEYYCPNVSTFLNTSIGNVNFNITDITYNFPVLSENININDITSQWNTLAQTGSTISSRLFSTLVFNSIDYSVQDNDFTWDIIGNVPSIQPFDYRINVFKYMYYAPKYA